MKTELKETQRGPAQPVRPGAVRAVIVDDYEAVRAMLASLLTGQGVAVVGLASSGEEALRLALELQPDVVLMDVSMPGMGGIAATALLRARCPRTRVVGLSLFDDAHTVARMLDAGASAFVSKANVARDLAGALRGVVSADGPLAAPAQDVPTPPGPGRSS